MKISELVKGESIKAPIFYETGPKLDNHHSGQEVSIDDQGLHLHKRFNSKSKYEGKAEVIIPINSGNVHVREKLGKDGDVILKEIRRAFSDNNIRKRFIEDIKRELSNLISAGGSTGLLNENEREKVNQAIKKVAEQFGMGEDAIAESLYESEKTTTIKFKLPINQKTGRRNFPEVLYVKADTSDISFFVTSAIYMLEDDF